MHVAIIMGGNRAWAARRGFPVRAACAVAAGRLRAAVNVAALEGVNALTLYAICAKDWMPPTLATIPRLLRGLRFNGSPRSVERFVCVNVLGQYGWSHRRLSAACAEPAPTRAGDRMQLRLVCNYSVLDEIVNAAMASAPSTRVAPTNSGAHVAQVEETALSAGPVDLLIRTGSENAVPDFPRWENAHAAVVSTRLLWPDFDMEMFQSILNEHGRL